MGSARIRSLNLNAMPPVWKTTPELNPLQAGHEAIEDAVPSRGWIPLRDSFHYQLMAPSDTSF